MAKRYTNNPFESNPIDTSSPQPISNGNSFNYFIDNLAKQEMLKVSINGRTPEVEGGKLKTLIDAKLDGKYYNEYWLLVFMSQYFTNLFQYDTKNIDDLRQIRIMVKSAFMDGKACLYKNPETGRVSAMSIVDSFRDYDGKITELKVLPAYLRLTESNISKQLHELKDIEIMTVPADNCAIFYFGTYALSAWIWILPMCKIQSLNLKQLLVQSYVYNKKFSYSVASPDAIDNEIEIFFDELNPFLINTSQMGMENASFANRLTSLELSSGNQRDFVDYIKESWKILYTILGIKTNDDKKGERNVVAEVQATQDQIETRQKEYIDCFKDFTKEAKQKLKLNIKIDNNNEKGIKQIKEDANEIEKSNVSNSTR